jgi:hypothetical protein
LDRVSLLSRSSLAAFVVVGLSTAALEAGEGVAEEFPPVAAPELAPAANTKLEAPAASPAAAGSGRLALKLPNFYGTSGFGNMFDARTPEGLTIRAGARLRQEKEELKGQLFELHQQELSFDGYAGIALFKVLEVGARLPFQIERSTRGMQLSELGGHQRKRNDGIGDLDVAAKVSIDLGGPVSLAPYAIARFPTASKRLDIDSRSGVEVGGAMTGELFESVLALHANVSARWLEHGDTSVRFRVGPSLTPLATSVLLVRGFVYLDGEHALHDNPGTDLRVAAGGQVLLFEVLTAELSGSYRFHASTPPQGLKNDEGTWSLELGAGFAF